MSAKAIAVSGIGYGPRAVAFSGFLSEGETVEIGNCVQGNASSSGLIGQIHVLRGASLIQRNLSVQLGPLEQVGVVAEPWEDPPDSPDLSKPGIPADAPEWLRTMLEIIVGRRSNKITPPALHELTFSVTPTKAECEALYAYLNEVRTAITDVITRLDS